MSREEEAPPGLRAFAEKMKAAFNRRLLSEQLPERGVGSDPLVRYVHLNIRH